MRKATIQPRMVTGLISQNRASCDRRRSEDDVGTAAGDIFGPELGIESDGDIYSLHHRIGSGTKTPAPLQLLQVRRIDRKLC